MYFVTFIIVISNTFSMKVYFYGSDVIHNLLSVSLNVFRFSKPLTIRLSPPSSGETSKKTGLKIKTQR